MQAIWKPAINGPLSTSGIQPVTTKKNQRHQDKRHPVAFDEVPAGSDIQRPVCAVTVRPEVGGGGRGLAG